MTRRTPGSGRRYAAGSHMVRGDYPRECSGCGKTVALNNGWQEEVDGVKRSYHHKCRLERDTST